MARQPKSDDGLIQTGKPDDPAKQQNPDTREEQQQAQDNPARQQGQDDRDPALETTRQAGQGTG